MAEPGEAVAGAASDAAATVKKFTPLNWALISNPWNWAILLLMVLVATLALDLLLTWYNAPDASD